MKRSYHLSVYTLNFRRNLVYFDLFISNLVENYDLTQ